MPKTPGIHTTHDPLGGWNVKREGNPTSVNHYNKKEEAVTAGRTLAQKESAEHFIHNENGKIAERNSYGNDSKTRKG